MLMGADIGIALSPIPTTLDSVERADWISLPARAAGWTFLPHHTARQADFARAHHRETTGGVLCLPESSGVTVTDQTGGNAGPSAVHVLTAASTAAFGRVTHGP